MIKPEEARRIAGLAMLDLSDDEAAGMASDLSVVLDYIEKLSEVETVDGTDLAQPAALVLRADEIDDSRVSREQIERIAPKFSNGFFIVPPVIG